VLPRTAKKFGRPQQGLKWQPGEVVVVVEPDGGGLTPGKPTHGRCETPPPRAR